MRFRRIVEPTVLALVVTLLPLTATAGHLAACPATIPSSGFTDVAGLSTDATEAVNCIAYYGIAKGTTSTTFSPNVDVVRWQMALFIIRSAEDMGIALPSGSSQGFTDIGGLSREATTAINQLRQLGITLGTSATTFSPNDSVPRWQMALFITRLLTGAGIPLPSGTGQGFTDLGGLSVEATTAINQLKQLGITAGTTATTFSPNTAVARWQMALFLARTLTAAGVVTPKVTVTASKSNALSSETVTLMVTVKNADGSNVVNQRVDVFVVGALNADGTCNLDADAVLAGGDASTGTNCTIDSNDALTNNQGQVSVSFTHAAVAETDIVYAWVGSTGAVFDNDVVLTKGKVTVTWGLAPAALDLTAPTVTQFGTSVTAAAQFENASGGAVALSGEKVRFVVTRGALTVLQTTVNTGSGGSASIAYVGPPDPGGGDDPAVTDTVKAFWDKDGDNIDDGAAELDDTVTLQWDDATPRNDSAVLAPNNASGLVGTARTVTATVRDKFGQPIVGVLVEFQVTGAVTITEPHLTDGAGVASLTYTGPATDGTTAIDARVDITDDGDYVDPDDLATTEVPNVTHFWVETAADIPGITEFDIVAVSTSNDFIDVLRLGTGEYLRLVYDGNDKFFVNSIGKTLAEFEAALAGLTLPALDGPAPGGVVSLETEPYDVGGITLFRLDT